MNADRTQIYFDAFDEETGSEAEQSHADTRSIRRLITFELGGELYGLPITTVAEIRDLLPIMPLPPGRAPAFVLGLINLRGMILPVVDLRRKFGLEIKSDAPASGRLVVVKGPGYEVALWVEAISGLVRLPEAAFQPAPAGAVKIHAEVYEQVARLENRLLIELNVEKLLTSALEKDKQS